jgi:hypothetical protein
MNISLCQLTQALRRTLEENVKPELQTDHARSQLAAVQDILGKLERMAVWSPDVQAQQVHVLVQACANFKATALRLGVDLRLPDALLSETDGASLRDAEVQLMQLTDWLFDFGARLARPIYSELDRILRQALREQLVIQRKLIPLTDFGAMTSAALP